MGLFGKILSGLEIVGGAVLMATGVGSIAGAMLITAGLSSSGLIGGSVGKFLKSGWGQGLMAAVSLGSTAYAMFGSSILQDASISAATAEQGAAQAAVQASSDASAQVTADLAAAGGSDLVPTGASIAGTIGYNTADAVNAASAAVNGADVQALTGIEAIKDPLNTEANLAMTQSTQNTAAAVNPGSNAAVDPNGGGSMLGGKGNPMGPAQSGAEAGAPTGATTPTAGAPGSGAPLSAQDAAGAQQLEGQAPSATKIDGFTESPNAPPSPAGGFLDKAMKFADTKGGAAAIQGAGSFLGGIGQGMEQKSAMEDQIRAQQWAGRTYMDPQAQSQIQGAAAQPITVPSGYLQRAQALRTMLNNNTVTGPGQPPAPVPFRG